MTPVVPVGGPGASLDRAEAGSLACAQMARRGKAPPASAPKPLVSVNALSRTFHVKCGPRSGSCFALDVEGRQYLVTATHLLKARNAGAVVDILHGGKWKPLDVQVVGQGPAQVDVMVLALKFRIALPELGAVPSLDGLEPGQDAFCLGFPRAEWGGGAGQAQRFPTPFVKKACVSAMPDGSSAARTLYLAGQAGGGFSGGPVVFQAAADRDPHIAAVISTFECDGEPVYLGTDQMHLSARHNPDIIVSYDIQHALDVISLNPIGFQLEVSRCEGPTSGS